MDTMPLVKNILEPHSDSYKDNLGKAKGLAKYAEAEPRIGRVQLIRQSCCGMMLQSELKIIWYYL